MPPTEEAEAVEILDAAALAFGQAHDDVDLLVVFPEGGGRETVDGGAQGRGDVAVGDADGVRLGRVDARLEGQRVESGVSER